MNIHATDLLAHFANVLLLVSYSVRDMLWLRWFAVASALTVMPYYVLQPNILWPPVFWGSIFTAINLYQIARIYMERRPVVFSKDEETLYNLGFQALRPRQFISLVLIGEWKDAAAGDQVLTESEKVSAICVSIAGTVQVRRHGSPIGTIKPGQLIGTALALADTPSPVGAAFSESGRYIRWPLASLRVFLDKNPQLRVTMQSLVNRDLAQKIEIAISGA
jgi:hypothetical protein